MELFIPILICCLAYTIAETPVGEGYPSSRNYNKNPTYRHEQAIELKKRIRPKGLAFSRSATISNEYRSKTDNSPNTRNSLLTGEYKAPAVRTSPSQEYGVPRRSQEYRVPSVRKLGQEYGVPLLRNTPNQEYGVPAARNSLNQEYGVPIARNSLSQEYGVPVARNSPSQEYGVPAARNSPSQEYGVPAARNSPSQEYGVPAARNSQSQEYGAPAARNSPSQEYGVPAAKSGLSQEYGVPNAKTAGLSQEYGIPNAKSGGVSQEYGVPNAKSGDVSQEYGVPNSKSADVSQEYGVPSPNSAIPNQEYGVPNAETAGLSQEYGAPAARTISQDYGVPARNAVPNQEYGTPLSRGALSQEYGAPSNPSSLYGAPRNGGLNQEYGVPKKERVTQEYSYLTGVAEPNNSEIKSEVKGFNQGFQSPSNEYLPSKARSSYFPSEDNSGQTKAVARSYPTFSKSLRFNTGTSKNRINSKSRSIWKNNQVGRTLSQVNGFAYPGSGEKAMQDTYLPPKSDISRSFKTNQEYSAPQLSEGYVYAKNTLNELDQEPANYNFAYKVSDVESGSDFGHTESRQANRAEGSYYVRLPNGNKQIVQYKADERGFKPTISVESAEQNEDYVARNSAVEGPY